MGRSLRIVVGVLLIVYVASIYFRLPSRLFSGSLILLLALTAAYCVVHFVLRGVGDFGRYFGSILVHALLVGLYVAGFFRVPVVGGGRGQLAAVTFLGISLVTAGIRGVSGCELMAIPNLFLQEDVELACLIFSPLDKLERKLRNK